MNSEAFIDGEFFSRPKINRLPPPPAYKTSNNEISSDNYIIWRSIYAFGIIALLIIIFIIYQYNSSGLSQNTVITSDDARLMKLVNSSDDIIEISDSGIYFKDNGGVIVGQMVKIAPTLEKNIKNTTVNYDDADTGRELLAILSKY